MIRKRNDSKGYERGPKGIDAARARDFSRRYAQDPWTVQPDCAANERPYSRLSNDNEGDKWAEFGAISRTGCAMWENFQFRAKTRSVASLVLDDAGEVNGGYSGKLPNVDMDN